MIIIFVLIIIIVNKGYSQYTPYKQFSTKDGLPSNFVYMVIQDSMGYYWIGTDNGLVRYDGYDFKTYTVADGLPSNDIYELHEDKWGRIWVFNNANHPMYIKNGGFYLLPDSLISENTTSIFEIKDSLFIISTQNTTRKNYYFKNKNIELFNFTVFLEFDTKTRYRDLKAL